MDIRLGDALKACLAALLTFSLGLLLIKSTHLFWDTRIETHIRQIVVEQAGSLERHIGRSLAGAQILGTHVHGQEGSTAGFEEMAETIYRNLGGITNLELAPGGVVLYIYPPDGHEAALGHNLLASDEHSKEALTAIRTGKLTVSGPLELAQGGVAIVARQPVFLHDREQAPNTHPPLDGDRHGDVRLWQGSRFWGFSSALIYLEDVLALTALPQLDSDYDYRLWRFHPDSGERQVIAGNPNLDGSLVSSQPVTLPNSHWFLEVGYQGLPLKTPLLITLVLCNIALTLLTGYWMYQLLTRPRALARRVELRTRELDVKNRRLRREKLKLRLFKNAVEDSGNSILITDAQGVIEYVNPRFCVITGYTKEEVIGRTPAILKSGRNARPEQHAELWRTISHGQQWRGELFNQRKDGSHYWSLLSISPVRDSSGVITHYVSVSEDITGHKEHQEAIEKLAYHDPLTGLSNRRYFMDQLDYQLRLSHRSGKLLGLLFLDLDHFKSVNDTLGHDFGDELLKVVGVKIQQCIRDSDLAARLGGDEFTILLPQLEDIEGARRVAHALVETVREPLNLFGHRLELSISVGIALADGTQPLSPRQLLKRADQALYQAKESGRDGYALFDGEAAPDDPAYQAETG